MFSVRNWSPVAIIGIIAVLFGRAHCKDTAPHEINCVDQADGLHEIGCWGYANCLNGKPDVHTCGGGTVLDRNTMTCVKPGQGNTDCFLAVDCLKKPDGSYADYGDKCISYYRCINELNIGRFYCPKDTAFNEALQLCDYPRNLPAPCGTNGNTQAPATTKSPTTMMSSKTTTTPPKTMTTTTTTTTTMATTTSTSQPTTTTPKPPVMTSQVILPVVG